MCVRKKNKINNQQYCLRAQTSLIYLIPLCHGAPLLSKHASEPHCCTFFHYNEHGHLLCLQSIPWTASCAAALNPQLKIVRPRAHTHQGLLFLCGELLVKDSHTGLDVVILMWAFCEYSAYSVQLWRLQTAANSFPPCYLERLWTAGTD